MPRARNIKPAFFKNEILIELPFEARLLFIGLWTLADREGRLEDRPKRIKMEIFPADNLDIESLLRLLHDAKFIIRYAAEGSGYIQIMNFTKHQMPHHKEISSAIPAPEGQKQITRYGYDVSVQCREDTFKRDNYKCLKCGNKDSLSIDHIISLAKGGDNSIENLQTLCSKCNSSKGDSIKDYRKANVEPTLSQRSSNEGASCPTDSLILIPDSPLLKPDILIPECGFQNTQNFKDLILEGEFLKVANEASLQGELGINCWKKWKATRENNPPDDVMGNWKVWVLNERVAERPQSEEKLQGADLQMQNLGAINWKRKAATRNSSFKPSHGELAAIHEWESANGNVWWDNLEQYKTGKPL